MLASISGSVPAGNLTYGEYSTISGKREPENKSRGLPGVWRDVCGKGEYRAVDFVDNVDNFVGKFYR